MTFSKTELSYTDKANDLLKGLVFCEQKACDNGTFDKAGVVQTIVIRNCIDRGKYPWRKYYNIMIKRRYLNLPPNYHTDYNFYVYVDDEEKITEITPLIMYNCDGMHELRKTPTKDDYVDIVYRLFYGIDAFNLL